MRVTGGEWSGRILEVPKGPRMRPTQDYVRAALFNILGETVAGARVLDLFAGSGAMGIEALSRGAAHATFVDQSPFCVRAIHQNLAALLGRSGGPAPCSGSPRPLPQQNKRDGSAELRAASGPPPLPIPATSVIRAEAGAAIRKLSRDHRTFDLVILDPPYGGEPARKALNALGAYAIVSAAGWVVAEHDKRDSLPSEIEGEASRFIMQRIEPYGDTALTFYRRQ